MSISVKVRISTVWIFEQWISFFKWWCLLLVLNNIIAIVARFHKFWLTLSVGEGDALPALKQLTNNLGLNRYVVFNGTKAGEELDKIFDESDVAIGSLGNHRKGLNSDSALKNREYCARGIPFVIASSDQDFPESFPYILKIPSDDSLVDINKIIEWYEELTQSHPNYSTEMRKYTEEHLSWDAKMRPVIEKIKEIAEEKGKSRP